MSLQIGEQAPDFQAQTTIGPLSFYNWAGDTWVVFFSHPKDFTPVCTTELAEIAKLQPNFAVRKTKVIALSVDTLTAHSQWLGDISASQNCSIDFPVIADEHAKIAHLYGMIHPKASNNETVRTVFFIAPNKRIIATINYPECTGRNIHEVLRVLDSLQLSFDHEVCTPANWTSLDDVLIPAGVTAEDLKNKYPKGFKEIYPYLRVTPQPDI